MVRIMTIKRWGKSKVYIAHKILQIRFIFSLKFLASARLFILPDANPVKHLMCVPDVQSDFSCLRANERPTKG